MFNVRTHYEHVRLYRFLQITLRVHFVYSNPLLLHCGQSRRRLPRTSRPGTHGGGGKGPYHGVKGVQGLIGAEMPYTLA